MKIVRRGALPVGGDSGLLDVRDRASPAFGHAGRQARGQRPKRSTSIRPSSRRCCRSSTSSAVKPLRVVIDAANGMAGAMLPPVLERLPIEAVRCFFEPDGNFPNHEPNPLLEENRQFIIAKVREEGADLGIAFDGDADRCFFVDDTGEFVPGRLRHRPARASRCSRRSRARRSSTTCARAGRCATSSRRAGGTALANRVGHAFIKHRMREVDAVFARRGLGPLLLPRLLPGGLGRRARPAHARAGLEEGRAALADPAALPRALLPHRRDQLARRRRRAEAPGAEGALRVPGRDLPPGRHLGRPPRTGT